MKKNLFINVVVVTRNRSKYLINCINSIINQSYHDYDITIIDNDSDDDTKKILNERFPNLKKIYLNSNIGCPSARNIGIENTSGDVLFFVDDDGELESNVLKIVNKTMIDNPNCASVVCAIKENGKWLIRDKESEIKKIVYLDKFKGQCAIRRKVISEIGLYPEDFFYGGEELDMSIRILANNYRIIFNPNAVTYHYRANQARLVNEKILREKNLLAVYIKYAPFPLVVVFFIDKFIDYIVTCIKIFKLKSLISELLNLPNFIKNTFSQRKYVNWRIFSTQFLLETNSISLEQDYELIKNKISCVSEYLFLRFLYKFKKISKK